jgi:hypothetical protein
LVQSSYDPFSDPVLAGKPIPELTRKYIAPGWPSLKPQQEWDHPDWTRQDFDDAAASDALLRKEIWNEPSE